MKVALRVKKNEEFQEIIKLKKFVACPSFALYVKPKSGKYSRFGISCGKKMGHAVVRNKIKRQCRGMLQELDSANQRFDGVLMVRGGYHKFSYDDNKKHLESMLKKVRI